MGMVAASRLRRHNIYYETVPLDTGILRNNAQENAQFANQEKILLFMLNHKLNKHKKEINFDTLIASKVINS